MGLGANIVADVSAWSTDIEKLLAGLAPGLGTAEEALAAISNVAKVISAFQTEMNTPAMQNASVNEGDLEKLEGP
jgi:hypothetical protein